PAPQLKTATISHGNRCHRRTPSGTSDSRGILRWAQLAVSALYTMRNLLPEANPVSTANPCHRHGLRHRIASNGSDEPGHTMNGDVKRCLAAAMHRIQSGLRSSMRWLSEC